MYVASLLIVDVRIYRKDQMKKNPMVSSDELDQVSEGLGEEAKEFEGKGGLGAMLGK